MTPIIAVAFVWPGILYYAALALAILWFPLIIAMCTGFGIQGDDGEEETFSLFDRHRFVHRDIPLESLKSEFTERSAFDPKHVVEHAQASDDHRRRLEKLVAAEQMAIATRELRKHLISDEDAFGYLTAKPGVLPQSKRAAAEVGKAFEGGIQQTDLDDF